MTSYSLVISGIRAQFFKHGVRKKKHVKLLNTSVTMPRKYDKKTKANFRAGRRNSRRASMRINMVSPGLSMFNDEFDPAIDDTMLMLKAKGIDRERERYTEALSEVRDKISRVR